MMNFDGWRKLSFIAERLTFQQRVADLHKSLGTRGSVVCKDGQQR